MLFLADNFFLQYSPVIGDKVHIAKESFLAISKFYIESLGVIFCIKML